MEQNLIPRMNQRFKTFKEIQSAYLMRNPHSFILWQPGVHLVYNEEIFKEIHQLNPNDVQLITVSLDPNTDTKESFAKFKQDYGGDWPMF